MLYSRPCRYRLFSNSECFVHKALMPSPYGSSAGLDGIPPSFETFDCRVEQANWTEFSQSLNKSCECDSRRKSTFRTSAGLLWYETNCAKNARWRTSSHRRRQYFPPVVRKMCEIPRLRITSSRIRKPTSRCRHQQGC